jgi:hypothetical protein
LVEASVLHNQFQLQQVVRKSSQQMIQKFKRKPI